MSNPQKSDNNYKICGIILAAGKSSRMGKFKPLLKIGGKTAAKRLIDSCKDGGIHNIVLVTGYNSEELEKSLNKENIVVIQNNDYEQGMFTSIQTGIKKALDIGDFHAFFLFLVDVPLVPAHVISSLYNLSMENPDKLMVPCYEGKKGHPLVIPKGFVNEILNHDGTNGLKGVTSKYDDRLIRVETGEESVVLDMDKPEDYDEILHLFDYNKNPDAHTKKESQNILEETGFNGRLYLVRHGNTKLHKEKILMGQIDIPLSQEGRSEADAAASSLLKSAPRTQVIYTSPLLRAKESAEIIKNKFELNGDPKKIVEIENFKEMALGDWDGKYISEIKEKYPEEYEKRGANLLTYKRSPDGENHYDLKYRVLKELKNILINTPQDADVIIVTHKGVINGIRENVYSLEPSEAIKHNPPKGSVTLIEKTSIQ